MNDKWFGKQSILILITQLIVCGILVFIVQSSTHHSQKAGRNGWGEEQIREYANKLKSQGLLDEAAAAYEEYLTVSPEADKLRANVYFNLGNALMEQRQYEKALAYFYKSEIAGADSSLKRDIGLQIVTCLEKLGKSLDAASAAEERVSLEEDTSYKNARGDVVAKIGTRVITMGEINDELAAMPTFLQQRYKNEKEKANFIRQYVANKVLVKKGISLQYQKDPQIRKQVELAREAMLVQKVIDEEVAAGIKPDEHDLFTYYEAHPDHYQEEKDGKKTLKPFEEVKRQVLQDYMLVKGEVRMQDYLTRLFTNYQVEIFYQPSAEETTGDKPAEEPAETQESTSVEEKSTTPVEPNQDQQQAEEQTIA